MDVVEPEASRNGFGSPPVVAGEHHDPQALGAEGRERFGGCGFDRISHPEERRQPMIDCQVHDRLTLQAQSFGVFGASCDVHPLVRHQREVADRDGVGQLSDDALAWHRHDAGCPWNRERAAPGCVDDRRAQRVFAGLFNGRGGPEHVRL